MDTTVASQVCRFSLTGVVKSTRFFLFACDRFEGIENAAGSAHDFGETVGADHGGIREMYGDGAIKHSKYLRLIINLQPVSA